LKAGQLWQFQSFRSYFLRALVGFSTFIAFRARLTPPRSPDFMRPCWCWLSALWLRRCSRFAFRILRPVDLLLAAVWLAFSILLLGVAAGLDMLVCDKAGACPGHYAFARPLLASVLYGIAALVVSTVSSTRASFASARGHASRPSRILATAARGAAERSASRPINGAQFCRRLVPRSSPSSLDVVFLPGDLIRRHKRQPRRL